MSGVRGIVRRVLGMQARRVRATDERMKSLAVPLDPAALAGAELLADRETLLDRLPKNAVAAEVGVAKGEFTQEILRRTQPARLYLIDAWQMARASDYGASGLVRVRERFVGEIAEGRVVLMQGWSHEKLAEIADASLDWIYIDAAHDYASVRRDLLLAHRKVKPGGLICGHDYVRWGRFGKRFGVVEAVNEFVAAHGYKLRFLTAEAHCNPSFALARSDR